MNSFFSIRKPLAVAGLALFVGGSALAGDLLDREEAIRRALDNNRDLKVASFEIAAAKARLKWAGKLGAPEIEIAGQSDRFGLDDDESVLELGISQRFPLTDRLKREKALTRVQVALAEAEIANFRRRLIGGVERAWIETAAARDGAKQLRTIEDLHRKHVDVLEGQAKQGAISRLEVNQAKLDLRSLSQELRRRISDSKQKLTALKTLLGAEADDSITLDEAGKFPLTQPDAPKPEVALKRRPDFRTAILKEDEARAELALAESQRWEDIAVRLFAERDASVDEPDGLERNTFLGIGISIPLPLKKERATAETAVARHRAEAVTEALALKIANEIAAAIQHRDDAHALSTEASGDTLELAEENLANIRKAYENGQYELIKYHHAQEQLLEARLSALEARTAYHLAESRLREAAASHPRIDPNPESSK